MESNGNNSLEKLRSNVGLLLSRLESAENENRRLSVLLEDTDNKLETTKTKIEDLNRQIDNLQFASAFSASSPDRKEAKARVEKLIREIDKCIALLDNDVANEEKEDGRECESQD